MKKQSVLAILAYGVIAITLLLAPSIAMANVESILGNLGDRLINTILPLLGIIGIIMAGISFFFGNPNAKNHLQLAIVGALIGFGAPALIDFIRSIVG